MRLKPLVRELLLALPDGGRLPIGTVELRTVHEAPDGTEDVAGPVFDAEGRKIGNLYCTLEPAEKPRRGRPRASDRKHAAALAWASGYMAGRLARGAADEYAGNAVGYDARNARKHRQDILADALLLGIEGDGAEQGAFLVADPEILEGPAGELRMTGTATHWKAGARVTTGQLDTTVHTPPRGLREAISAGRPVCLVIGGGEKSGKVG